VKKAVISARRQRGGATLNAQRSNEPANAPFPFF
jgi:hypothetical protein